MRKIYINEEEKNKILYADNRNCWICQEFRLNIQQDNFGFFIAEDIIEDFGMENHLEQILGKQVIYAPFIRETAGSSQP